MAATGLDAFDHFLLQWWGALVLWAVAAGTVLYTALAVARAQAGEKGKGKAALVDLALAPGPFFPHSQPCPHCLRSAATCDNAALAKVRGHPLLGFFVQAFYRDREGSWWEARNDDGATLFLFLFLLREYDLAMELIQALQRHGHTQAARFLLSASYSAGDAGLYLGENALHMAIAQREKKASPDGTSLRVIRWLCAQCPPLVQGRATGSFFQKSRYTDQRSDDTCDWGEYPLSFAVSLNEPAIVCFLVRDAGADMLAQDTQGNTALHAAVINRVSAHMIHLLRDLFCALAMHPCRPGAAAAPEAAPPAPLFPALRYSAQELPTPHTCPAGSPAQRVDYPITLDRVVNNEGLTPLMLAALLDTETTTAIFSGMINHLKFGRGISWNYAHVTCFAFSLEAIDDVWDCDVVRTSAGAPLEHPFRAYTSPRVYPGPLDEGEGEFQTQGKVVPFPLSPPKLWPRRTLLEVISQNPVKDMHGVCTEEFVKTMLEKKWLMYVWAAP